MSSVLEPTPSPAPSSLVSPPAIAPLRGDGETLDLAAWQARVDRSFVPLQVRELDGVTFAGRLRTTAFEDVSLFEIVATPHVVRRTPALIEQVDGRYYKLSLQLEGTAELDQDGRHALLQPGDLAIYDTHRPYQLTFASHTRSMVMMFPHEYVDLSIREVAETTAVRLGREDGLSGIVSHFFVDLANNLDDLSGPHAARLVRSSIDLLVTVLSSRLHGVSPSPARRDTLLRDVRAYIQEHLSDPELSPASIAEAHFVSTRHLHGLFADEELTVAALIRTRRLERIRRALGDPLRAGDAVSTIAGEWGLCDAAQFSKMFKAQYAETPSAYRRRVRGA